MKKISIFAFAIIMSLFVVSCGSDTPADTTDETTTAAVNSDATATPNPATPAKPEAVVPTGPLTSMKFEEIEFDYGVIDAGEKVLHEYKFTNTGKEPLIISNAKGSCGCTVPEWPKDPIAPGATSAIKVQFDSKNKKGKQSKRVTITANTEPAQTFLTIKGEVTPDPNAPVKTVTPPAVKK